MSMQQTITFRDPIPDEAPDFKWDNFDMLHTFVLGTYQKSRHDLDYEDIIDFEREVTETMCEADDGYMYALEFCNAAYRELMDGKTVEYDSCW